MRTVHKFNLFGCIETLLSLPIGAEVLCVKEQYGQLVMWVKLDTNNTQEVRRFMIFGTGHEIPAATRLDYIDTVQLSGDQLVLHVFEVL